MPIQNSLDTAFMRPIERQYSADTSATPLSKRVIAEMVGTAMLLAAIVGSGIMGERRSDGNFALGLLANTIATGTALVALILAFGAISGAHFNPAVTLADATPGWSAMARGSGLSDRTM